LIERAVPENLDLQLAEARVREARARQAVAAAALWPSIDATASITRERESENAPRPVLVGPGGQTESHPGETENLFRAGFDANWELDMFGGRHRSVEAAQAELEASAYDRGAVILTLVAEVARNYIELRGFQQQIAVAQAGHAAQADVAALTRSRHAGGMATELDLARADAQLQRASSEIPALEAACDEAVHGLSVLLGQPPGTLAEELRASGAIPVSTPPLPVGLPSDLLRQRPDIRQAERQLAAAASRKDAATADLYPRFSLLGNVGLASIAASDFFSRTSGFWAIGPSMIWPIFRHGQIVATIEVRDAQRQQALIGYRRAILNGLKDVENAIAKLTREEDRRSALAVAVGLNQRAVDLARSRYIGGMADFRDVLDAQLGLFRAQRELTLSETACALDRVALYKALGGGWDVVGLPSDAAAQGGNQTPGAPE
jgi:NodT family efflux transporter outer membrane factor (OMF) lipoprotein